MIKERWRIREELKEVIKEKGKGVREEGRTRQDKRQRCKENRKKEDSKKEDYRNY